MIGLLYVTYMSLTLSAIDRCSSSTIFCIIKTLLIFPKTLPKGSKDHDLINGQLPVV